MLFSCWTLQKVQVWSQVSKIGLVYLSASCQNVRKRDRIPQVCTNINWLLQQTSILSWNLNTLEGISPEWSLPPEAEAKRCNKGCSYLDHLWQVHQNKFWYKFHCTLHTQTPCEAHRLLDHWGSKDTRVAHEVLWNEMKWKSLVINRSLFTALSAHAVQPNWTRISLWCLVAETSSALNMLMMHWPVIIG